MVRRRAAVLPALWGGCTIQPSPRCPPPLRPLHGFSKGRAALPILRIEDAPARERQPLHGNLELAPGVQRQDLARSFGRLEGRIPAHQRHAAGVAAEVDGRQIGVSRDDRDVERIDAEYFSDDVGED